MVRETAPVDIGVSVAYPLPGTKFHRDVLTRIGSAPNWSDSADLAMVFQGAYPSEFYRALADALHIEVRGGEHLSAAWERVYGLGVAEAVA
jgi:anaerobic magnesium-protoporphyrin IX monomethyl ester cyclase